MLKNAVAVVTGGASGLGKATVERFIRNGLRVVMADLPTSNGADIAQTMGCTFVPVDITSEEQVTEAFQEIRKNYSQLDVLVNCAGTTSAFPAYNFLKKRACVLETYQKVVNTNVVGTYTVIREAVALMAENKPNVDGQRGVIVNTAGVSAFNGELGQASSATSNHSIVSMTLPLARELAQAGIRVATIAPGMFETPMVTFMPPDVLQYIGERMLFPHRIGKPEEFAHLVDAIIDNPMLNGVTIRLDGGLQQVI